MTNLSFTHDFKHDLEVLMKVRSEPVCFVRFGDGERRIIEERPVLANERWVNPGPASPLGSLLLESLQCNLDGWHIGISCPCCDPNGHKLYQSKSCVQEERRTYANIFANSNWQRFLSGWKDAWPNAAIVGSRSFATIKCPENLVNCGHIDWLYTCVAQMYEQTGPILLAAGPGSNVLAYYYWNTVPHKMRQTVIDIGSALDHLEGEPTRNYQREGSQAASKICHWSQV